MSALSFHLHALALRWQTRKTHARPRAVTPVIEWVLSSGGRGSTSCVAAGLYEGYTELSRSLDDALKQLLPSHDGNVPPTS